MTLQMIHRTMRERLESVTGVNAYPNFIPQDAEIPAIAYRLISARRAEDSNLINTSVSEQDYMVWVYGSDKDFKKIEELTTLVIDAFDGTGDFGGVMSSEVVAVSDDFNHDQTVYIQAIQLNLKVKSD